MLPVIAFTLFLCLLVGFFIISILAGLIKKANRIDRMGDEWIFPLLIAIVPFVLILLLISPYICEIETYKIDNMIYDGKHNNAIEYSKKTWTDTYRYTLDRIELIKKGSKLQKSIGRDK